MLRLLLIGVGIAMIPGDPAVSQTSPRATQSTDCRVCQDKERLKCPTCKGKGLRASRCLACDGRGSHPCLVCVPLTKKRIPRLGKKKLKKGWLPCTNRYCLGGTVKWDTGSRNRCKVCSGRGVNRCLICRSGKALCLVCSGRKKTANVCWDCGGRGTIACPGCMVNLASGKCPLCFQDGLHACHRCRDPRLGRGT